MRVVGFRLVRGNGRRAIHVRVLSTDNVVLKYDPHTEYTSHPILSGGASYSNSIRANFSVAAFALSASTWGFFFQSWSSSEFERQTA